MDGEWGIDAVSSVRLGGGDGPRLDPVGVPKTLSEETNFDRVIGLSWSVGQGGGERRGVLHGNPPHALHCTQT
jgi:hypothetical protein